MSETPAPQSIEQCGGEPQPSGESAVKGNDATPPVVQAEIVCLPRTRRESAPPSPSDNREAARKVRAARRQEMLAVFFVHQPGALRIKRDRAHAIINRVADPVEREALHRLYANCWNAAASAPPVEGV